MWRWQAASGIVPAVRRTVSLPTGGKELSFIDEGPEDGPAVVLVHGMPGNQRDFKYLAPAMSDRVRVLRVDLPGFGESPVGGLEVDDLARALLGLLEALDLDRPLLAGHSYGGVISTAAADLAPRMVGGLGLICSPALRIHRGMRRIPRVAVGRVLDSPLRPYVSPPLVRVMHRMGFSRRLRDDEHVRCFDVIARYRPEVHRARLKRTVHPTLQVWCEDDPLVEAEVSRELDAHLRRHLARHVALSFASGGHNPQKEHARELGAALADFAEACASSRLHAT